MFPVTKVAARSSGAAATAISTSTSPPASEVKKLPLAHLDLIQCSSEDEDFPAFNLETNKTDPNASIIEGWQSEKFCEYPQELIFSVNRGIPTRISQLQILSHHTKIASRIEVFVSDAKRRDWSKAHYQRLGFCSLNSNQKTNFATRELKTVPFQIKTQVTLIRLLLHSCHPNDHNMFSQVGLVSVNAIEYRLGVDSGFALGSGISNSIITEPVSRSSSDADDRSTTTGNVTMSEYLLSPLKVKYHPSSSTFMKKTTSSGPLQDQQRNNVVDKLHPLHTNRHPLLDELIVWTLDQKHCVTANNLLSRLLEEKTRHETAGEDELASLWEYHERQCLKMCEKFIELNKRLTTQQIKNDDPIQIYTIKADMEEAVRALAVVVTKLFQRANHQTQLHVKPQLLQSAHEILQPTSSPSTFNKAPELPFVSCAVTLPDVSPASAGRNEDSLETMMSSMSVKTPQVESAKELIEIPKTPGIEPPDFTDVENLEKEIKVEQQSDSWQVRVQAIQKLNQKLNETFDDVKRQAFMKLGVSVLMDALKDENEEVFGNSCTVLHTILASYDGFKQPKWQELTHRILDLLLVRFDDTKMVVRNCAALSMLRVGDCIDAGGTFVINFLLRHWETHKTSLSETTFYAMLKIISSLLLAFHCCATIDIAPKRVMKFMTRNDGYTHSNTLIREACKQLTLTMYMEVGDMILKYLRKLPPEIYVPFEEQFQLLETQTTPRQLQN